MDRPEKPPLGGHEAVRDAVLEDVELARRTKQAGFRIWFGPGEGMVSTRMYRRFSEMWVVGQFQRQGTV